ncbi:MAG TPA: ABC transporter ATP-binding protein [Candidatus Acidoferrum sp.]|nr:ABC transporter ATP-binding protein [Candidatus Acidoferrum sp.]
MTEVVIDVKNVRKEFSTKHVTVVAIDDVSFKVEKGEVVLILGPSGSGKTTLLSMIGCIMTPTSGEICVNGKKTTGMSEQDLVMMRREHIGFVFQSFNLLKDLTVQENVEIALNLNGIKGKEARERARDVLIDLGMRERLTFLPADLSGGEKQRVSIARAMVNSPKILLADEPTGNLDSKTGQMVGNLLKTQAKEHEASTVVVTHDNRIESIADRILFLEDGMLKMEQHVSS